MIRQSTAVITQAVLTDRLLRVGAHVVAKIPALLADVLPTQSAEPVYALIATPGNATGSEKIPLILSGISITPEIVLHKKIAKAADFLGTTSQDLSRYLLVLEREVPQFTEFNLPVCKLDCMHLLGMELTPHKGHLRMSGFHHDYLGQLEKSSIIRIEVLDRCAGGFYEAQVWVAGIAVKERKTFFPQHWTREQVVKCIVEVYQDSIKQGIKPRLKLDGKYLLEHFMSKYKVNLRFHLDQKNKILSVYPFLEENYGLYIKVNQK